jgi:hypothetical protein
LDDGFWYNRVLEVPHTHKITRNQHTWASNATITKKKNPSHTLYYGKLAKFLFDQGSQKVGRYRPSSLKTILSQDSVARRLAFQEIPSKDNPHAPK